MGTYNTANGFFEVNMIKDFKSSKMQKITQGEVAFLKRIITDKSSSILDVMCGYGRIGNMLFKDGYIDIEGVDVSNFDFITEKKLFKFYNSDFYNWNNKRKYDYAYSLYNSYNDYDHFLRTINKCKAVLNDNGTLIIDIFNKQWRDNIPASSYRIVEENDNQKVELFREYDGLNETSRYIITSSEGVIVQSFSQCVISKEKLYSLIPDEWNMTITDSLIEKTREDNQKNILILRKKVNNG